jgi:hypothetical protein
MKNLKLLVLLSVLFSANSVSAQWLLTGNTLTGASYLGSNNNFDIIVKRNGVQSGLLNSASGNTSWGVGALNAASPNTANTAIGYNVLPVNTSGGDNTGTGYQALNANTAGSWNTAYGMQTLFFNNTGHSNVAIGYESQYNNTTGIGNVSSGFESFFTNTTGGNNVATGSSALFNNTTGGSNSGYGGSALASNTTGSFNTALGFGANVSTGNLTNATAIGANSVVGESNSIVLGGTGTNTVNVGIGTTTPDTTAILELKSINRGLLLPRIALTNTTSASPLGYHTAGMTLYNTATAGSGTTAVTPGYYYDNGSAWVRLQDASPTSVNWSLTGNAGTVPGTNFMGTTDDEDVIFKRNNVQSGLLDNASGNTSFGVASLNPSSPNVQNTAIGYSILPVNTTGGDNTGTGYQALNANTAGSWNTAYGMQTLFSNNTGHSNVAIGYESQYNNTSGVGNVSSGFESFFSNTTGGDNVATGSSAMYFNTTGGSNAGYGGSALASNTTGSFNTALGFGSNVSTGNLTDATAIGSNAVVTASNNMAFGDNAVVGWGFGGAIPTATNVLVVGTNSTNGNGAYLTSGGMWMNASDRNLKEDISSPDSKDVLEKIKKLSVTKWKYKGTSEYHIGPMAQDFYDAFNLGTDNKHIGTTDPAGVALIAIQELAVQNDSLKNVITQQQDINNNTQQQLNDLKTTISQMQTAMSACCNSYSSSTAPATAAKPQIISGSDIATLKQNTPNPYTDNTVISYHLPQSTTNAEIIVVDLNGNVLRSISLNGNGDGQITFAGGSFASGSYFYTLLINGQKIDTKEMIIAN